MLKRFDHGLLVHFSFVSALIFLFLSVPFGFSAEIKLAWNSNTEPDLAGYRVYYGTSPRTGTNPKSCGLCGYSTVVTAGKVTSYTLGNLITGQNYYVSLTATDTSNNESGFSNEVNGTAKDSTSIQIPGKTPSAPALAWNPVANKLHIVVQGASHSSIWAGTFDSSGVFNNDWILIPGKTTDSAPALAWDASVPELCMILKGESTDSIWFATFSSSGNFNNDWVTLPGMTTPSSPGIAYLPSRGFLGIIVRDSDDSLWWGLY